jgi:hypothetical protein
MIALTSACAVEPATSAVEQHNDPCVSEPIVAGGDRDQDATQCTRPWQDRIMDSVWHTYDPFTNGYITEQICNEDTSRWCRLTYTYGGSTWRILCVEEFSDPFTVSCTTTLMR